MYNDITKYSTINKKTPYDSFYMKYLPVILIFYIFFIAYYRYEMGVR